MQFLWKQLPGVFYISGSLCFHNRHSDRNVEDSLMKWMIIWWVIHPGHSQLMRMERGFPSESACKDYGAQLQAPTNKVIRWHCSLE